MVGDSVQKKTYKQVHANSPLFVALGARFPFYRVVYNEANPDSMRR
jgi:hypothetical protein